MLLVKIENESDGGILHNVVMYSVYGFRLEMGAKADRLITDNSQRMQLIGRHFYTRVRVNPPGASRD